jgi:excisionase family DNA binding protein
MPKKTPAEGALFVRLPNAAVEKLHRAAEALGMRKKDLVAGLVSRYVDPDSPGGLGALGTLSTREVALGVVEPAATRGAYSFQPYDPPPPPEVMTAAQAAAFLQIDERAVIELAAAGKLPGRRLGGEWRFSRAAIVAWLATPEKP